MPQRDHQVVDDVRRLADDARVGLRVDGARELVRFFPQLRADFQRAAVVEALRVALLARARSSAPRARTRASARAATRAPSPEKHVSLPGVARRAAGLAEVERRVLVAVERAPRARRSRCRSSPLSPTARFASARRRSRALSFFVRSSAASSAYASMRTSPVRSSCTTTGIEIHASNSNFMRWGHATPLENRWSSRSPRPESCRRPEIFAAAWSCSTSPSRRRPSGGGFEKLTQPVHRRPRRAPRRRGSITTTRPATPDTRAIPLRPLDQGRARRLPRDGHAGARRARRRRWTRSSATTTSTASAAPPSGCAEASSPTPAPTTTRARSTRASARRARTATPHRPRAPRAPARHRALRRSIVRHLATASPTPRSGARSTRPAASSPRSRPRPARIAEGYDRSTFRRRRAARTRRVRRRDRSATAATTRRCSCSSARSARRSRSVLDGDTRHARRPFDSGMNFLAILGSFRRNADARLDPERPARARRIALGSASERPTLAEDA